MKHPRDVKGDQESLDKTYKIHSDGFLSYLDCHRILSVMKFVENLKVAQKV